MATAGQTFTHRRVEKLLALFMLGFLILAARLIDIQFLRRGEFRRLADRFHCREVPIPAMRGVICDRTGHELAVTIPTKSVYMDPSKVKNADALASSLAPLLDMQQSALRDLIEKAIQDFQDKRARDRNAKPSLVKIKRKISYALGERIDKMELPGIALLGESRRTYPYGRLASQVIGFTDIDGAGQEGLELSMNKLLAGQDGLVRLEVDGKRRVISETRQVAHDRRDGSRVTLTLDQQIQFVVERELAKMFASSKPAGASAIVLDVRTGEILALANMPTFDPNKPSNAPKTAESAEARAKRFEREAASRRDRAVTDLYEPGSTLKTVSMSAALEENVDTHVFCPGTLKIGRRTVHCAHGEKHGSGDYLQILQHSCNVGAATVGLRLGANQLYKYVKAFGFQAKPGSGLPGEQRGWLDPADTWPDIRTANVAFGHGVAVTPLQVVTAYAAIANGGVLMRPQIIREIRDPDGKVTRAFRPARVRQIISPENARKISQALEAVVMDGTGRLSKIEGYHVAGKTGTAQKVRTDGRGYAAGKYIGSFVGYLPARDPRVAILVVVDEPKGSYYGGTTAGPVFREIARNLMWYYKIPPDDPYDKTDGSRLASFRKRDAAMRKSAPSLASQDGM